MTETPGLSFVSRARLVLLGSLFAILLAGAPAAAAPMPATGGTSVYLSSADALAGLGLTVDVLGVAQGNAVVNPTPFLPSPTVTFKVTAVDAATVQIFHDGSGIELSVGSALSVKLENFVINGLVPSITADVTALDSGVSATADVFDLRDCRMLVGFCVGTDGTITVDGLGLFLTDTAISVLEGEFGMGALGPVDGDTLIGVANSTFIPEPSTALLIGGGLIGLASRRRGRA